MSNFRKIAILIVALGSVIHAQSPSVNSYDKRSVLIKTKAPVSVSKFGTTQLNSTFAGLSSQPSKIKSISRIKKDPFKTSSTAKSSESNAEVLTLYFDSDQNIPELIKQLKNNPDILIAEPNRILYLPKTQVTPNDPLLTSQYHINLLKMTDAWATTPGTSSVSIAVIDTGIDINHPDFVGQLWQNTAEVNGITGIDDDGNGRIDDKYGWNTDKSSNQLNDLNGHGTHVSGIAAAAGNNSVGIAGIAYGCKIMTLKSNAEDSDSFYLSSIIESINYAIDNNASIINMSLGGRGEYQLFNEAISDAYDAGISIVVAAGNESESIEDNLISPAIHPDVITVAAANDQGEVDTEYSNFGRALEITAPGTLIYSTYPPSTYRTLTGTSMATPIVSGVLGLLKSAHPTATQQQLLDAITATALDKNSPGKDIISGYGLIQPAAALKHLNAPKTRSSHLTGDYIQNNNVIEYTFQSIAPIRQQSIVATINNTRYTLASPHLTFTPSTGTTTGTLRIDLSSIPLAGQTTISLYYEDTNGEFNTDSLTLVNRNDFGIDGPNGEGSKVINAPNPFDPDREPTVIGFQSSQSALVSIEIYTLTLNKVFDWQNTVSAGYHGIEWSGRDLGGTSLPNGVYIMILTARSDSGQTIKKQSKIAISRRKQ
jgi:subtilisin family serine protease